MEKNIRCILHRPYVFIWRWNIWTKNSKKKATKITTLKTKTFFDYELIFVSLVSPHTSTINSFPFLLFSSCVLFFYLKERPKKKINFTYLQKLFIVSAAKKVGCLGAKPTLPTYSSLALSLYNLSIVCIFHLSASQGKHTFLYYIRCIVIDAACIILALIRFWGSFH